MAELLIVASTPLVNPLAYAEKTVKPDTEVIKDIQHFVETLYNRMRIQAKLNFRLPAQVFEGFDVAA